MVILILISLLFRLIACSSCLSGEFLLQGTCKTCSTYIPSCSSCSSGSYLAISNPSFEDPLVPGLGEVLTSVPGWTIEPSKKAQLNTVGLEPPKEGNQFVEMGSETSNYYVYQDLVTTSGHYYQINLYYSGNPGVTTSGSSTNIYWGDTMGTVSANGIGLHETSWQLYESEIIQASDASTQLKIEGDGNPETGNGIFIDLVSYINLPSCDQCNSGLDLVQNTCVCPQLNCETCNPDCVDCSSGYYLYEGSCLQCNERFETCPTNGVGISCKSDYLLVNGLCVDCFENCSVCTSSGVCTDCSSGYYLYEGNCFQCNDSFLSCPTNGDGLSCKDGYFLDNGLCLDCPENCSRCVSSSICVDCSNGFYSYQGDCLQCLETMQFCPSDGDGLSCNDGYYLELLLGQCYDCPKNCSKCESLSKCTECKSPYALEDGECICSEGRFEQDNSCVACTSIDAECILCDSSGCSLCFDNYYLSDGKCLISISENEEKAEQADNSEKEENLSENDGEIIGLPGDESGAVSAFAGLSISVGTSLLSGNPSILWLFLNVGSIIYFIPLIDTGMTQTMKNFLQGFQLDTFQIIPNFGELIGLKEETYKETSKKWRSYDIASVSFLINSGESVSSFLAVLSCLPGLYLLYIICCFHKSLLKWISEYKWNFFLRFWIQTNLEFLIFGLLSFQAISSEYLGLEDVLSIILLVLAVGSPFMIMFFLLVYRTNVWNKETFKTCSFFYEFKNNKGICMMMYYFFFFARRVFFAVGLFYLEDYKLIQVIVNTGFSMTIIFYLLRYKPYREKSALLLNTVSEICILIVFSIAGLCLINSSESFLNILTLTLFVSVMTMIFIFLLVGISLAKKCISINKHPRSLRIIQREEQTTTLSNKMNKFVRKSHQIEAVTKYKRPREEVRSQIVVTQVR